MNNRQGISIDINPLAVFIVKSLIAPVKQEDLAKAFKEVKTEYMNLEPKTENEIKVALKKYPYPKGLTLPKDSDVETVEQLFSDKH